MVGLNGNLKATKLGLGKMVMDFQTPFYPKSLKMTEQSAETGICMQTTKTPECLWGIRGETKDGQGRVGELCNVSMEKF